MRMRSGVVVLLTTGVLSGALGIPVAAAPKPPTTTLSASVSGFGHLLSTYPWTLQKGAQPPTQDVPSGNSGTITWTITATRATPVTGGYFDGKVCVQDTGQNATQNLAIQAKLTQPPSATVLATVPVDVSVQPVLSPQQVWCYPYRLTVPAASVVPGATYKVAASVTITNRSGSPGVPAGPSPSASGSLPAGGAVPVDASVTVTDSNGMNFSFGGSGSQSYQQSIPCATSHDSSQTLTDTATITQTGQTASASAAITCTARTITGTGAVHYFSEVSATANSTAPIDYTGQTVEALMPNGIGGFTTYPGSGSSGSFSVPGVPPGQYILHVGSTYLVTDANSVDLGTIAGGRAGETPITQSTTVGLNLGNVDPWQAGDTMEFYAPNANTWGFGADAFANPALQSGDTAVALPLDLSGIQPANEIHGSAGDRAFLAQLSQRVSSTGITYQSLSRLFEPAAFDLSNGGSYTAANYPTNPADLFTTVTPDSTLNVDYRGTQFSAALASDGNPNQAPPFALLGIESMAGTNAYGFYGPSADQLLVTLPTNDDIVTGAMAYPSTLPEAGATGSWGAFADLSFISQVPYTLPGTTIPAHVNNGFTWVADPAQVEAGPLDPVLSPPLGLSVNGASFFGDQTGVTTSPTVRWTAPALGTPDYYQVTVYQLHAVGSRTLAQQVATLFTPNTAVLLPGMLAGGGTRYVISVSAVASTGAPPDITTPLEGRINTFTATVSSGMLTP
jgi:hypothetical protein